MGNQVKTKAIIISSIRWKESSKIVTLYSEEFGKIKVIARGVLRKGSNLAGKIETLFLIDAVLDIKKSRTLNLIVEADVIDAYSEVRLNLKLFPFGLTFLEIISQVLDETQPDKIFFNFILEMEDALQRTKFPEIILIYFLLKLSSYLGFKPVLEKCQSGDLNLCSEKVLLSMSDGSVSCKNCTSNPSSPLVLKKDQFLYLQTIQKVNHRRIGNYKQSRSDFFQIIQILLQYINYHIDREIRTDALQMLM